MFNKIPIEQQRKVLYFLLRKAKKTEFGKQYNFISILDNKDYLKTFQMNVPFFDYKSIKPYWEKSKNQSDICWPGKINFFAISSGTSGEFSKLIPISLTGIQLFNRESIKAGFLFLKEFFWHAINTQVLGITDSTTLENNGSFFSGYASGILIHNKSDWVSFKYKPPRSISDIKDWNMRVKTIIENAKKWNIGTVVGIPAQTQLLFEKIIERYKCKTIHDIWPNFKLYMHGGTYFEPYKKSFEKLLKYPIKYLEIYAASEGEIAYQRSVSDNGMKLILDQGVFFEFIPFTDKNFDSDGQAQKNAEVLTIEEVKENIDYAIVISTVSGAWRYLLGDLIRFTDKRKSLIKVSGRTSHFLNLAAEHVTVGDLDEVVLKVSKKYKLSIKEYTVCGFVENSKVHYHWFLGLTDTIENINEIKQDFDDSLKEINREYAVERKQTIGEIYLDIIPPKLFFDWLKKKGKEGAQVKFPRVIKSEQYQEWKEFLGIK